MVKRIFYKEYSGNGKNIKTAIKGKTGDFPRKNSEGKVKLKLKKKFKKSIVLKVRISFLYNFIDDITETNKKQVKKINAKYANFLFNNPLNEKNFKKNKDTLKIIANNEDFNYSLEIFSEKNDAIDAKKIKNKKECFSLSENDAIILKKTIALNKKGIFYNIKADNKDGKVYLMATENIPDNTLLTIVGGKIYYNYQYLKNKIEMPDKMSPIIPYFETANRAYDRIISVCPFSIVRFLFTSLSDGEGNLQLKKIIDSEENILLCVLTNGLINKGDILSLNNEILLNPDLVL